MTSTRPDYYGRIVPESVDRMRLRIGVREPGVPAWYREAHPDTMRHFAWSFGDDNPLFGEPDYGSTTRWGSVIASPFYFANLSQPVADEITPEMRENSRGALAGLHEFHAASEFWFYRAIQPGDHAWSARAVTSVEEKTSAFGGGNSVLRTLDEYVEADGGAPVVRMNMLMIHTEREKAQKAGTEEKTVRVPAYSEADIDAIEADIRNEQIRGAEPRFWEDVQVGDTLPHLTKGPMTITDIVGGHIGRGPGHYAWGPLRLAVRLRDKHRGFFTRNEYGAWDIVQRVHWDQTFAQQIGAARIYDYGTMRQNWLGHLLTDWMGDDGLLLRMRCEFRKFNYIGDVSRITGTVTAKNDDGTVEIELGCTNQDGVNSCPGNATVALPTRSRPHPAFPEPPTDWRPVRR